MRISLATTALVITMLCEMFNTFGNHIISIVSWYSCPFVKVLFVIGVPVALTVSVGRLISGAWAWEVRTPRRYPPDGLAFSTLNATYKAVQSGQSEESEWWSLISKHPEAAKQWCEYNHGDSCPCMEIAAQSRYNTQTNV